MKYFFILFISLTALSAETEVGKLMMKVKQRKEEIKIFINKVSKGDVCQPRDYACFEKEVMHFLNGHVEDIIEAREIHVPFYDRATKGGFPPCEKTCLNTMKASHVHVYVAYLRTYNTAFKDKYRFTAYPTVNSTRVRSYMDLSAFHRMQEDVAYLLPIFETVDVDGLPKDIKRYKSFDTKWLKILKSASLFYQSILCQLAPGDVVYDEIMRGERSPKRSDQNFSRWMKDFDAVKNVCERTSPIEYKGTDESTRAYYRGLREKKMAAMTCAAGDFGCVRKNLRELGIHYTEDVQKVAAYLKQFVLTSKPADCDETCEAQLLIRTIQTWVSYLSSYERGKLASTLDWKEHPEARYLTITEDVTMFETLKEIFDPLIVEFGKIDPRKVTDPGLKSEMKSVGKDLSDFSSGRMLKDSVICTMDPWNASYDKYMVPYKDKELDKKFEISFLDFKEAICK